MFRRLRPTTTILLRKGRRDASLNFEFSGTDVLAAVKAFEDIPSLKPRDITQCTSPTQVSLLLPQLYKCYQKYGPLFKGPSLFGNYDVIWVNEAQGIAEAWQHQVFPPCPGKHFHKGSCPAEHYFSSQPHNEGRFLQCSTDTTWLTNRTPMASKLTDPLFVSNFTNHNLHKVAGQLQQQLYQLVQQQPQAGEEHHGATTTTTSSSVSTLLHQYAFNCMTSCLFDEHDLLYKDANAHHLLGLLGKYHIHYNHLRRNEEWVKTGKHSSEDIGTIIVELQECVGKLVESTKLRNLVASYSQNCSLDKSTKYNCAAELFNNMLQANFSLPQVISGICSVFLGGVKRVHVMLYWLLYELACHIDIQHALRQEMLCKIGDNDEEEAIQLEGSSSVYERLHSLKWVHNCLFETFRMHPVVPVHEIAVNGGCVIMDHIIPNNVVLALNVFNAGRDTELFFPDEDLFIPQRWSKQSSDQLENGNAFHAQNNYGKGIRCCPAADLANRELVMALFVILQKFEVVLPRETKNDGKERTKRRNRGGDPTGHFVGCFASTPFKPSPVSLVPLAENWQLDVVKRENIDWKRWF